MRVMLVVLLAALAWGCSSSRDGARDTLVDPGGPDVPLADVAPDATVVSTRTVPFEVVAPGAVGDGLLTTAVACATCHTTAANATAMRDSAGRDVAPYELWQGSMKANSARDPFFLATLSVERERFPELADVVDAKCFTCHAPLATLEATLVGETVSVTDLATADKRGLLGADGVSCTSCHGIAPEGAGTQAVWGGNHAYTRDDVIFGPHSSPVVGPMRNHVGLTPAYGDHVLNATLCASCHTLMTHALDLPDAPDFPEQTPFLEWENSSFAAAADPITCQDCHMPTSDADGVAIVTRIARRPPGGDFPNISPRSPYGRHLFVGGNTLVPELFKRYRAALQTTAPDAAFDATIAAARDQLERRTAQVSLDDVVATSGRVSGRVRVDNLAGHKFPSGYPSRRAWLHVKVVDAAGATLFESGATDALGRLLDADGGPLASELPGGGFTPHRVAVTSPDEVQVWEAIQGDKDGLPVIALLRAVSYLKDNRFLPSGWRADGAHADRTAPVGVTGDSDFVAGSDTVRLDLPVTGTPAELEVSVRYQVLGARWAAELFLADTPDVRAFETMVREVGLRAETVGTARHRF